MSTQAQLSVKDEDQALAARLVQEVVLPFMQRTLFSCPGTGYYTKLRQVSASFWQLWPPV